MPPLHDVALEGLSRERVALAMAAADVTVMTSDAEGSPVTVRESLSCMTPVVSVDVGDVARVVADLPGCGIFPRDVNALARGVLDALAAERQPEPRHRAQRYSRQYVARSASRSSPAPPRATAPTQTSGEGDAPAALNDRARPVPA